MNRCYCSADIAEPHLIATVTYTNGKYVVYLGQVGQQVHVTHSIWLAKVTTNAVKITLRVRAIALHEDHSGGVVLLE
ncbi:hypothetical protein PAGU2196_24930 [Pseudomonas sp. PAGU 2196]|nr:hypothetical protein PAGU2196_24930 [Pseudomonas sp. PAGU 2196]